LLSGAGVATRAEPAITRIAKIAIHASRTDADDIAKRRRVASLGQRANMLPGCHAACDR
jgi:hypothetical protein